ncbi:MAG: hypothetical protein A4E28_02268 [Methanocella sp. PtaU1.Bin125]|nr:MAG: hypothetical protein A4E28_02268 [Methanocella sp. PtaU1.Bin125]
MLIYYSMLKKLLAIVFVIILIGIIYIYQTQLNNIKSNNIQNITFQKEEYLSKVGGNISKIYLVNSCLSYGVFENDLVSPYGISIKKGEPCVIINGTIRNDYKENYFVGLSVDFVNQTGSYHGIMVSQWPGSFITLLSKSNETSPFEMRLKYGNKDVKDYKIYIAYTPSKIPPP